jgi:hypothetical protein
MKKRKKIGIGLVSCSLLSIVSASLAYAYQQTKELSVTGNSALLFQSYQVTTNPYRDYTFPLILLTVALFVVGSVLMVYRPKIKNQIKVN